MISKKTFIETIETIEKQYRQESAIGVLLEDMTGYEHFFDVSNNVVAALLKVLEEIFEDTTCGWISWWIYEKDFGKKNLKAVMANKKGIKLKTAGQLYDFLIKERNEDT